jgi:hypothetical protein
VVQGPEELTRPNLIIMKKPSVQKFDGHIKGQVIKSKDMMKDMMKPKVKKTC